MGDIHGADNALQQCLERSKFDSDVDTLIQIGDVTDKWPGVYECVETLLKIKQKRNLIAIRGNHDDYFLDFINKGVHANNWGFGSECTFQSYIKNLNNSISCKTNKKKSNKLLNPKDIPAEHKAFFKAQLTYYIDQHNNCFIHGGFNRHLPFEDQCTRDYYCDRKLWSDAMEFEVLQENLPATFFMHTSFKEVFIGHTPTTNWYIDEPMHCANVWNLDTGVGSGGKLTIMDVATKEFWQSDAQSK
jgi:serine/threonine protein phosphatase 1